MELDLCDLLDREEMTWLEMQQAGFNVDPLVTGYCGDEVAVWVHVEDSAGTRKEHVIASPSYLRKSGWFQAALDFKEQQPEQITVSVAGLCWMLSATALCAVANAWYVHCK